MTVVPYNALLSSSWEVLVNFYICNEDEKNNVERRKYLNLELLFRIVRDNLYWSIKIIKLSRLFDSVQTGAGGSVG